uniref:Uncharacterized protein n=1 Tax=Rhizophora mucronata TaxID=61149 RepID=A0A2P2PIQ7_RHIMU
MGFLFSMFLILYNNFFSNFLISTFSSLLEGTKFS